MTHAKRNATVVNQEGVDAFATGRYHVGYGAIAVAALGTLLILGGVSGSAVMVVGIVLLAIGVGILVDTWAHGYFH